MLNKKLLGSVSSLPSDPNFENVTLLLSGDGTNGAQNNTFLDSSTNNFTITRNGNTTQGSFSPYGSNWSNYFDGSGDNLTFPSGTAFQFGTGDFTIESWVFLTSAPATQYIIDARNTGQTTAWAFGFGLSTSGRLGFYNGSTTIEESSVSVVANTWAHCVAVRSGTTLSIFVNGTRVATATNSTNLSVSPTTSYIGSMYLSSEYMTGYLSNVRTVKGTAVYSPSSSTLTVPTTPLTAVTNTSLLTCQSNRFRDNSTNNFTITVNGNTSVQRFSPFNPTAPYSTSVIGGSGYFDGSGDYLNANNVAAPGSGNFTIEFWVYNPNQSTTPGGGIDYRPLNTQGFYVTLGVGTDGSVSFYTNSAQRISTTLKCQASAWNHVALVKSSGTTKIYVNGVADAATYADSNTYLTVANRPAINGSGFFATGNGDCYISNFRIVVGTAVYTSNFTPPTAPLTAITNTSLLLNTTNAGIPDLAMMNNLETVGNAQVSTSVKKYGTGSLAFDGTGDYLYAPNTPNLQMGTGDYTVEFWIYANNFTSSPVLIEIGRPNSSPGNGFQLYCPSGVINVYGGASNSTLLITAGAALSTSAWNHVALTRASGSTKLFINGTQSGSTATDTTSYTQGFLWVSANGGGGTTNNLNGYIDDLRVTKGLARYTADFTPPASALPSY